jgi:hypothetical protein
MTDFDEQMNIAKRVMIEDKELLNKIANDIRSRLERLIKPEFVDAWLNSPNASFNGKKPIELIINGDTNSLYRMLYVLESGEPLL